MSLTSRVLDVLGIKVDNVRGARAWALCPFHEDKHATNFFIRPKGERAGQWHCFACKEGGGLVELVSKLRDCSEDGAKEWIAKFREGEGDEQEGPTFEGVRLRVESVSGRTFRMPQGVVRKPLDAWPELMRAYAKDRHLTPAQVQRWAIGYSAIGRLSGRLVIPVRDRQGVDRSYMARTFVGHDSRYFYPNASEGADLDCLFGEQYWPEPRERKGLTVVVGEGAFNALAVERAEVGFHIGALGGSDPRPMHVAKLASFTRVLIMTDEDEAGEGAAHELYCQLARHTQVLRVTLGGDRDWDEVSSERLREVVWHAAGS